MSTQDLTAEEARVIGCLMEKSVVTPDQYPLTLNALTNACNQKSSRNPVMNMSQGEVQHCIRELESRYLVHIDENFKRGVEKYTHRFCNTRYSDLQLDSAQFAIVCVLLLRGPQTPGELKAHSGRLHSFTDNNAVVDAVNQLIEREAGALLVKLPRTLGRKDSEYMHLFCGAIDIEAHEEKVQAEKSTRSSERVSVSSLEQRISDLEMEVEKLKQHLDLSD